MLAGAGSAGWPDGEAKQDRPWAPGHYAANPSGDIGLHVATDGFQLVEGSLKFLA